MSAAHWLGDCGATVEADPYGIRKREILGIASAAAFTYLGVALGLPWQAITEGLYLIPGIIDDATKTHSATTRFEGESS